MRYYVFIFFFFLINELIAQKVNYSKIIGGSKIEYGSSADLLETEDGGHLLVFYSTSKDGDLWKNKTEASLNCLEKYDVNGKLVWQKFITVSDFQAKSGIEITIGSEPKLFNAGGGNILLITDNFLIAFDESGKKLWSQTSFAHNSKQSINVFEIRNVLPLETGGLILCGAEAGTLNNRSISRMWIARLSVKGEIIFNKWVSSDQTWCEKCREEDGFLINSKHGTFTLVFEIFAGSNYSTCFFKFNIEGKMLDSKLFAGLDLYGESKPIKGEQLDNGDFVIAGEFWGPLNSKINNFGDKDLWLCMFDSSFNYKWHFMHGGSQREKFIDYRQSNNFFYLLGSCGDNVKKSDGNNGIDGQVNDMHNYKTVDATICKINANGIPLWFKAYGGSNDDYPHRLHIKKNGDLILGGESASRDFDLNDKYEESNCVWIMQINPNNGNPIWSEKFGSIFTSEALGKSILCEDDEIVCVGSAFSNSDIINGIKGNGDVWMFSIGGNLASPKELIRPRFELIPNPAKNVFFVLTDGYLHDVHIYNSCGVLIKKVDKYSSNEKIIVDFKPGIYFVLMGGEKNVCQKLIIAN